MTCDERIEKLLNKAGQTISDLPSSIEYSIEQEEASMEAAADFGAGLEAYILHLTDVIDRLEWALDKTVRERDYLEKIMLEDGYDCYICAYADTNVGEMPCYACDFTKNHFESAGIPEDWRADDENPVDA